MALKNYIKIFWVMTPSYSLEVGTTVLMERAVPSSGLR
jgi:hypothetical protein